MSDPIFKNFQIECNWDKIKEYSDPDLIIVSISIRQALDSIGKGKLKTSNFPIIYKDQEYIVQASSQRALQHMRDLQAKQKKNTESV